MITKLKTEMIGNQEVDIAISTSGMFYVMRGEMELGMAETLEGAISKAKTTLARNRVKISVPFVTPEGERGVATGLHGRTSNILVRYESGGTEQTGGRMMLRGDIPDAELEEYRKILDAKSELDRKAREFRSKWSFDHDGLAGAVHAAIKDVEAPGT